MPQQAWVQNMTLKDNILFGKKDFQTKYKDIINACQLEPDLKILPAADMTEIGEKVSFLVGYNKCGCIFSYCLDTTSSKQK